MEAEPVPEPAATPLIAPGHTFATVTDTISSVVLTQRTPRSWIVGFAISFLLVMVLLDGVVRRSSASCR